ncbi:MAG: epoxide hydrolase [Kibdelosporangium sp.]
MITPCSIRVPESDLADLRARLHAVRWPERETVRDWSQGVPLAYLRDLCAYWADEYDWRATEARLNAVPNHRTEIDGLGIHFQHIRSPEPGALPLVLTHGWPGSIIEFGKVIGPLTDPAAHGGDPADAFHVVCPSLPGYGFSDRPGASGWGVRRIAEAWTVLMDRLGHRRYGAVGSDWGTTVSTLVAEHDPDHVAGIHLVPPLAPPDPTTFDDLTEREPAALATLGHAARCSPRRSSGRPGAGRKSATPTSATGTSPPAAATSRRSNSRTCSSRTSAPSSGWSADCPTRTARRCRAARTPA